MEHTQSPFYTTAEFAALFKRRPRSVLAIWRKNNTVYGVTPIKIGERIMWPKDQAHRVIQKGAGNPKFKCLHCGSESLFFEPVAYEHEVSCRIKVWCDKCAGRSTLAFDNFGVSNVATKEDLNSNMALTRDDDFDHFAFHADERKQNVN